MLKACICINTNIETGWASRIMEYATVAVLLGTMYFALQENMWLTLVLRWQTFIILMTTLVLQEISTNGCCKMSITRKLYHRAEGNTFNGELNCFVVWLTGKRCLVLFPAGTIARDAHHREFPTRRMQDLNRRRTWVQALLDEVVQQR